MPYIEGRVVHDADAHIMETPTWLRDHADPEVRDRIEPLQLSGGNELRQTGDPEEQLRDLDAAFEQAAGQARLRGVPRQRGRRDHAAQELRGDGSFIPDDRPRALDLIGVASQLVFNTFHNRRLHDWEHGDDLDLAYGVARAHNRGMVEFCSVDPRLLPTLYVPLADFERAAAMADEALGDGRGRAARRVGLPAGPLAEPHRARPGVGARRKRPASRSCSTSAAPATCSTAHYFQNGLPIPPDFHGGEENFRSVDYMGIPHPPMQTLATMIFDGVLERFPELRIGVIEQGAIWVPSWMRQMESAFDAFVKHEERLRTCRCGPSEYVRRQVRATPYPTEDVGWIIEQSGPEVCLFSSDYPHVEGGRKPLERFEASLGDASDDVRERFYRTNFEDLMGPALAPLSPSPRETSRMLDANGAKSATFAPKFETRVTSVVETGDGPVAGLEDDEAGDAVVGHHLEAGAAPGGRRVPPALLHRPRPAHAVMARDRPAGPITSRAGDADNPPRPLTRTGSPRSSSTLAAIGSGDGGRRGAGRCPGQGGVPSSTPAERSTVRSTAAAGMRTICSPGRRPPRHSGTVTASGPSRPSMRARARMARSSAPASPPQKPSWRPVAGTTSSGARRSSVMPEVGRCAAEPLSQPSSCHRARSAMAPVVSAPS